MTKAERAKRKYMEIYIEDLLTKLDKKRIIDFDFELTFEPETTFVAISNKGLVITLNIDHREILKADYNYYPNIKFDEFFLEKGYNHYMPFLLHELGHIQHARENFKDYYFKNTMQRIEACQYLEEHMKEYLEDNNYYGIMAHYQTSIERTANKYAMNIYHQMVEKGIL